MKLSRERRSGKAEKGSQYHLQNLINKNPDSLNKRILNVSPTLKSALSGAIKWVSPLEKENYLEYQDEEFLEAVGYPQLSSVLLEFWPNGGPVWDALGVVPLKGENRNGVIILEAKSRLKEIEGGGCDAQGESREHIKRTLEKVQNALGSSIDVEDWLGKYYQYANRLAHLYFLLVTQKIPTWLVFLYFGNDREQHGPTSKEEWDNTLEDVKHSLGLRQRHILSNNILNVFYNLKD